MAKCQIIYSIKYCIDEKLGFQKYLIRYDCQPYNFVSDILSLWRSRYDVVYAWSTYVCVWRERQLIAAPIC